MKNITLKKEDIGKGELVLINPDYTLKSTINNLVSFDEEYNNIKLNNIANYSLHLILNNINAENKIVPVSGYRTLEEQKDIYNTSLKDNGREYTQKYVALPNASEHQTGLAIDLALNEGNIDFICPKFPYYGICQNFRNIAPKYGFIERYKDEKESNHENIKRRVAFSICWLSTFKNNNRKRYLFRRIYRFFERFYISK